MIFGRGLYIIALIYSLAAGCAESNRDLVIKINAKTPSGDPVSGAEIMVDGKLAGQTNAFGSAQIRATFQSKSRHQITISKSDDKYYFAPHVESLKMTDKTPDELAITPTMYLVPKPRQMPHQAQAAELPQESPAVKTVSSVEAQQTMLPLPGLPDSNDLPNERPTKPSVQSIITAHVYSGRLPLAKARVIWSAGELTADCQSNERGRCLLQIPHSAPGVGQLIVMADGYQAASAPSPTKDKDNFRVSLKPGSSFVVKTVKRSLWDVTPLADLAITYAGASVKSDSQGIAIVATNERIPQDMTLTISPNQSTSQRVLRASDLKSLDINVIPFATTDQMSARPLRMTYPKIMDKNDEWSSTPMPISEIFTALHAEAAHVSAQFQENESAAREEKSVVMTPVITVNNDIPIISWYQMTASGRHEKVSREFPITDKMQLHIWKNAIRDSLNDALNNRLEPGIITKATDSEIMAMGPPQFLKAFTSKTARLTIHDPAYIFDASEVQKHTSSVKLKISMPRDPLSAKPWSLIGLRISPIKDRPAETLDLTKYQDLNPEFLSMQMARKKIAENDLDGALAHLESADHDVSSMKSQNLRHTILQRSGKIAELRHSLFAIIRESHVANQRKRAAYAEISLARLQAESLPIIPKDPSLLSLYTDLMNRCSELQTDIESDDLLALVNLKYASLLAARKRAESAEDLINLATLKSDIDQLVTIIKSAPNSSSWKDVWLQSALAEQKHYVIGDTADDSRHL